MMDRQSTGFRLFKAIWSRRWLILTSMLTVVSGTLWWASGQPHVYESSVLLTYAVAKEAPGADTHELLTAVRERLWQKSIIDPLIEADFRQQKASGESDDKVVEYLRRSTNIASEDGSGIVIRLRYRDRTPERSKLIAGHLGSTVERLQFESEAGQGANGFTVTQPATLSPAPIMPRRLVLAELGIGIGVLLGLVLAGLAELASKFRDKKLLQHPGH